MGPTHPLPRSSNNAKRQRTMSPPLHSTPHELIFRHTGTTSSIPQHLHKRSRHSLRRIPSSNHPNQTPRRSSIFLPRSLCAGVLRCAVGCRGPYIVFREDYICPSADCVVGLGLVYVGYV